MRAVNLPTNLPDMILFPFVFGFFFGLLLPQRFAPLVFFAAHKSSDSVSAKAWAPKDLLRILCLCLHIVSSGERTLDSGRTQVDTQFSLGQCMQI
jgi:hypothetical protein